MKVQVTVYADEQIIMQRLFKYEEIKRIANLESPSVGDILLAATHQIHYYILSEEINKIRAKECQIRTKLIEVE